jgi:hypothetical protein
MKLLRIATTGALAIAFAMGCGDSTDPQDDVTIADLVGNWNATSMQFTSQSNPSVTLDLITQAFGSMSISINPNGSFEGTFKESFSASEQIVSGTVTLQGNTITIAFVEGLDEDVSGTFTLAGDVLTVSGTFQEFDFTPTDGNDDPEPANLVLVLRRE